MADQRGTRDVPLLPKLFIFICQIVGWHPLEIGTSIWEIQDPPLKGLVSSSIIIIFIGFIVYFGWSLYHTPEETR